MENQNFKQKILEILEKTQQPLDIEKIRKAVGCSHWNTCLKHCLELVLEGKIYGWKTSKSWVFVHPKNVEALKPKPAT